MKKYRNKTAFKGTKQRRRIIKRLLFFLFILLLLLGALAAYAASSDFSSPVFDYFSAALSVKSDKPIRWVEFDIPSGILEKALAYDVGSYQSETHLHWIELLAYLGAKYGGDFSRYMASDMDRLVAQLKTGEYTAHLAKKMKHYNYYLQAYTAVLGGMVGEYEIRKDPGENGESTWVRKYGLKAFSPIADGYWYNDYDDFGTGRTYGYARRHLGHDLIISTGTPIISVESGIVEALGWNQYGGWRIGIRSLDKTRYYYYAHLRKGQPYAANLYVGKAVNAGDVIGYSGQTGYSTKENVNNIDTPHLHLGMQLIFEEDKRDSPNQIWINLYSITKLLSQHRVTVEKKEGTKEFIRTYDFQEPNPNIEPDAHPKASADQESSAHPKASADQESSATIKNPVVLSSAAPSNSLPIPANSLPVPILMYHGLLKDPARHNQFVISPKRFEEDLKYLKENNYETITMSQLIDYVQKGVSLPKKPIILSFDDGYYNNYLYAFPLLKKYDAKAVISIIGRYTDEFSLTDADHANYSHITWDEINDMIQSGHVEIQNHTYNMHTYDNGRKGSMQKYGESIEVYKSVLLEDIGHLQQRILEQTGWLPNTFAYPFGYMSTGSTLLLKELGFSATLSCTSGINYFPLDKAKRTSDQLYVLKRILRPPNLSAETFFQEYKIL